MRKYFIISLVVAVVLAFLLPFQFLLNFAHDDSFFYVKTASNFVKGLGSTFDGINPTNGYHPLYFILLSVLFFVPCNILKSSPEVLYRFVVLLHFFMIIGMQYFIFESLRNIYTEKRNRNIFILAFLSFSSFVFIRDFGLESHLACLIISVFIYIQTVEIFRGENKILFKSLLISCLFLTRTDYIFSFIPLLLIADYFVSSKRKPYILLSLSLLILTAVIYYSLNYLFFGNTGTVSGRLLNGFPTVFLAGNVNNLLIDNSKLFNQFARMVFVLFALILFITSNYKSISKDKPVSKFNLIILSLGIGSLCFTFIHLAFNVYGIREWYMTLPVFISVLMIITILHNKKIIMNISLILSVIMLIYVFYGSRLVNYKYVSGFEYAKALKTVVKEHESIYQVDYCGVVAFFSDRNVINGDGLINSFEYLECLKNNKISEYLFQHKINYYSTYSTKSLLHDSVYVDDNFSDKINGKVFRFPLSSLVMEKPFKWNHIAFDLDGKWYLFKLN